MINRLYTLTTLLAITLLSSCEIVGGIFKAGAYVGIFAVLAVILVIFWLFRFIGRR
jgi:hypothetical protein